MALAKAGQATVGTVAKTAQLDRSEIYRGISELQKLGLVEKIISVPNIFKPTPTRVGLSILLDRRTIEFAELKEKTVELMLKSENENLPIPQDEKFDFTIIPQREVALRTWMKATANAEESLDYIIRWEGFIDGLVKRRDHLRKILSRGVRTRGIVSKPRTQKLISRTIAYLKREGSYDVKCIFKDPSAVFSIIDGREVILNVVPAPLPYETHSLWSKNPSLAAIVQDYFEIVWRTANEYRTERAATTRTPKKTVTQYNPPP